MGFRGGSAVKESTCNEGDLGLIPGLGRSLGEGKAYPLQHSGLENSMDSPWVAKSLTQISDFLHSIERKRQRRREADASIGLIVSGFEV